MIEQPAATSRPVRERRVRFRLASPPGLLVLYAVALGFVAWWPTPVDRPVSWLVLAFIKRFPVFSYTHIEFLANIALFVPLGLLLALTLPSRLRYLVLPIGITATVFIEGLQALLLPGRSWSLYDIVANTAGACVGLILAALVNERGDSGSQQP